MKRFSNDEGTTQYFERVLFQVFGTVLSCLSKVVKTSLFHAFHGTARESRRQSGTVTHLSFSSVLCPCSVGWNWIKIKYYFDLLPLRSSTIALSNSLDHFNTPSRVI